MNEIEKLTAENKRLKNAIKALSPFFLHAVEKSIDLINQAEEEGWSDDPEVQALNAMMQHLKAQVLRSIQPLPNP